MEISIRLISLACIFSVLVVFKCVAQTTSDGKTYKIPRHDDASLDRGNKRIFINTDFQVLDGILWNDEEIPTNVLIEKTLIVRDTESLKKWQINSSNKSYMFYFSEVPPFYKYVYAHTDIPLEFIGINIPILVNDKLILPNEYESVQKLNPKFILKTSFIPKSALEQRTQIVYGAIFVYIQTK